MFPWCLDVGIFSPPSINSSSLPSSLLSRITLNYTVIILKIDCYVFLTSLQVLFYFAFSNVLTDSSPSSWLWSHCLSCCFSLIPMLVVFHWSHCLHEQERCDCEKEVMSVGMEIMIKELFKFLTCFTTRSLWWTSGSSSSPRKFICSCFAFNGRAIANQRRIFLFIFLLNYHLEMFGNWKCAATETKIAYEKNVSNREKGVTQQSLNHSSRFLFQVIV